MLLPFVPRVDYFPCTPLMCVLFYIWFLVSFNAAEFAEITVQRAWECWTDSEWGRFSCGLAGKNSRGFFSLIMFSGWQGDALFFSFANKEKGWSIAAEAAFMCCGHSKWFMSNFLCKPLFLPIVSSFLWHRVHSGSCNRLNGITELD